MRAKFLSFILLTSIILLGAYLRLANLDKNPNGLYIDEASVGYNSWSILLTGKDEYGKDYPLAFRFLGSYTPPIYTYLTQAPIHFFGLSVTSVRLTSAISGILLIPIVFLFIKSLNITKNFWTPFFASLFLTVSPWDIFYSRAGYETHLAFLFYTAGVWLLWLGLKKTKWFILGAIFLALSANTYQAERLLAPLTLFVYVLRFRNTKRVWGILTYLLLSIPQLLILFTPAGFSKSGLFYSESIIRQAGELSMLPGFLSMPVAFLREFFAQYFTYFSPRNLFFQPEDDLQRSLPQLSVFYPWMVFFYLVGLWKLIKLWKMQEIKFIVLLLAFAPIPASLAGDPFSTQRSLPLLLPILITVAIGVDRLVNGKFQALKFNVVILITIISLLFLYRSMAVLLPNERATTWGYGFDKLAEEIKKRPNEKFLIDYGRNKPAYIELAFFLKIPPETVQQVVDPSIKGNYYQNINWDAYYKFGQIETKAIKWEDDIYKEQILVGDELSISESQAKEHFLTPVFEIKGPGKDIIFRGFRTNPSLKCSSMKGFVDKHCQLYE